MATYTPTTYEIQRVTVAKPLGGSTPPSVQLGLTDYLTPNTLNTSVLLTDFFVPPANASVVQKAIERLPNVAHVDVAYSSDDYFHYYLVTFLSNLGDVPMMNVTAGGSEVTVAEVQKGVTEVQTITLASDVEYTREVQTFFVPDYDPSVIPSPITTLSFSFNGDAWYDVTPEISSPTANSLFTNSAITAVFRTMIGADNSTITVAVSNTAFTESNIEGTQWSITFLTPVGDVPPLSVRTGPQNSGSDRPVTEATKGVAPSTGTFTVYYEGAYSADIPYNAGAAVVKAALEGMANIGPVQVGNMAVVD